MRKMWVSLGLMLTLAIPAFAQSVGEDHLITPGQGIGKLVLGMTIMDAVKGSWKSEDHEGA